MRNLSHHEFQVEKAVLNTLCLGAHMEAKGDELHLHPNGADLPDALVSLLKMHKKDVLQLLHIPPGNVVSDIQKQAIVTPHATALIFSEQSFTYAELMSSVASCAIYQEENAGVSAGQRVAVLLSRSPELVIAMLALLSLGVVVVPLDKANPKERLLTMLEQADPVCVLCDHTTEHLLAGWAGSSVLVEAGQWNVIATVTPELNISVTGQVAYLLFTSGSTGIPKGVLVSHNALSHSLHALIDCVGIDSNTRMLAMASAGFDIAWFELLAPLMEGGQVYLLCDEQSHCVKHICNLISNSQVNCVQATPSRWKLLLMQGWQKQAQLTVISGGEALTSDLARSIWSQQGEFWNLYGPTEATIWAMAQKVNPGLLDGNSSMPGIGVALPHMSCRIETTPELPADEGELCLAGYGLALGYFRDSVASEKQFVWREDRRMEGITGYKRWYCTGDLARHLPDQTLAFLGRIDRQVKVNGYRMELQEIELALKQHSSVADAVLVVDTVQNDGVEFPVLVACVVAVKGSHNKTGEKLNTFLSRILPHYMLPVRYRFLDRLPLTVNGKVDHTALATICVLPSTETEFVNEDSVISHVKRRLCELLELKHIGVHDSFFDAGGSSILAATLLMTLNNDFHLKIPLASVLARPPTASMLGALVEQYQGFVKQESGLCATTTG